MLLLYIYVHASHGDRVTQKYVFVILSSCVVNATLYLLHQWNLQAEHKALERIQVLEISNASLDGDGHVVDCAQSRVSKLYDILDRSLMIG